MAINIRNNKTTSYTPVRPSARTKLDVDQSREEQDRKKAKDKRQPPDDAGGGTIDERI